MRRRRFGKDREPTIALINIVFLMLVFFLVAGTIARPLDRDLTLVRTETIDATAPADALVVHADGRMSWRGAPVSAASDFLSQLPQEARARVRIVPDRDLPAGRLVALGRELQSAGAESIAILSEQGLR